MVAAAYGTRAGLYGHGLRADALVSIPRAVASADPVTDTLVLRGHGLSSGDLLTFEAAGGTLPGGISSTVVYAAVVLSGDLFQVTLATGGPVVDLTTGGGRPFSIVRDLDVTIDTSLRAWSRHIDQHLPAHSTPLELPVPEHLELYLYWLVAYDLVVTRGLGNAAYKDSASALGERAKLAQAKLDDMLAKVRAVTGATDRTSARSENAPRGVSAGDRGWDRGGGL